MEKNKLGKYLKYAIAEIILVMVGILLAVQVNNWNENRKSKIKEIKTSTKRSTPLRYTSLGLAEARRLTQR